MICIGLDNLPRLISANSPLPSAAQNNEIRAEIKFPQVFLYTCQVYSKRAFSKPASLSSSADKQFQFGSLHLGNLVLSLSCWSWMPIALSSNPSQEIKGSAKLLQLILVLLALFILFLRRNRLSTPKYGAPLYTCRTQTDKCATVPRSQLLVYKQYFA